VVWVAVPAALSQISAAGDPNNNFKAAERHEDVLLRFLPETGAQAARLKLNSRVIESACRLKAWWMHGLAKRE
jgi:hypothetical protein